MRTTLGFPFVGARSEATSSLHSSLPRYVAWACWAISRLQQKALFLRTYMWLLAVLRYGDWNPHLAFGTASCCIRARQKQRIMTLHQREKEMDPTVSRMFASHVLSHVLQCDG